MMIPVFRFRTLTAAMVTAGLSLSAAAQMPGGPDQPDQVDQLAQLLELDGEQQTTIRSLIDEIGPQIEELQSEAQAVQLELQGQAGADFDEDAVRETAARLGDLTGEITALTVILQSRVNGVFTAEQRERLAELERQQQEMQQRQMQQQLQQQMQQPAPGQDPFQDDPFQ